MHSTEAEQSLIGGLLLDNQRFEVVEDIITADDFYRQEHRAIYTAIASLIRKDTPADVLTVTEALGDSGELEAVGGMAYIGSLVSNTPSAASVKAYANIVRDRSLRRRMTAICSHTIEAAQEGDIGTLLDNFQTEVLAITDDKSDAGPVSMNAALVATVDQIDARYKSGSGLIGLPTGFADLDDTMCGLEDGSLIVIAARPGMGKTTLALNITQNVIMANRTALFFSLEMPTTQLMQRMISSSGHLPFDHVRTARLEDDDWPRMTKAMTKLNGKKLFIDETPGLPIREIRARARRMKRTGLDLIVIDYLQLMTGQGDTTNDRIEEITRELKRLAKELSLPIIALSQLNRGLEKRPNKRPILADLRDSGAIEQDADTVLFIYQDEFYNPDTPSKGTAEIIIGKQRNGPVGTVLMTFQGKYCQFVNYTREHTSFAA